MVETPVYLSFCFSSANVIVLVFFSSNKKRYTYEHSYHVPGIYLVSGHRMYNLLPVRTSLYGKCKDHVCLYLYGYLKTNYICGHGHDDFCFLVKLHDARKHTAHTARDMQQRQYVAVRVSRRMRTTSDTRITATSAFSACCELRAARGRKEGNEDDEK